MLKIQCRRTQGNATGPAFPKGWDVTRGQPRQCEGSTPIVNTNLGRHSETGIE